MGITDEQWVKKAEECVRDLEKAVDVIGRRLLGSAPSAGKELPRGAETPGHPDYLGANTEWVERVVDGSAARESDRYLEGWHDACEELYAGISKERVSTMAEVQAWLVTQMSEAPEPITPDDASDDCPKWRSHHFVKRPDGSVRCACGRYATFEELEAADDVGAESGAVAATSPAQAQEGHGPDSVPYPPHVHAVCVKCGHEQHERNWCERCKSRVIFDTDDNFREALDLLREAALESEDGNGAVHHDITDFLNGVTRSAPTAGTDLAAIVRRVARMESGVCFWCGETFPVDPHRAGFWCGADCVDAARAWDSNGDA